MLRLRLLTALTLTLGLDGAASAAPAPAQSPDCPAEAPADQAPCPTHGLSCGYVEATCTEAQSPFDTVAICLHGLFSVHTGVSGC